ADGHLDAIVGTRTEPDAALEQPTEWDPELEPAFLGAVVGSVGATHGQGWFGLDGAAWLLLPAPGPSMVSLPPRAGLGAGLGPARFELAARYEAQVYPIIRVDTNGRAEGLGTVELGHGKVVPDVSVEGIDRRYPWEPKWSFSTGEADLGVRCASGPASVR